MPSSATLRWSDAWLLTAIYFSSATSPAPLTHILAASDLVNHATPTIEELQSGLARLEMASLIVQAGDPLAFQCTPESRKRIDGLRQPANSLFDLWKALEVSLGTAPWIPGEPVPHPDNTRSYPGLTAAVFSSAINSYFAPRRTSRRAKRGHGGTHKTPV
jgi:hypothetical protein